MTKTGLSRESERHKPLTASDRLRDDLERLENLLGTLGRGNVDETLTIPALMDDATSLLETLQARGSQLQAEESRMRTIRAKLERNAPKFLSTVSAERLVAARPPDAPEEHWWWYADRKVAEQRRAALNQSLRVAGIFVAVLAVLVVIYKLFLAPDPMVVERIDRLNRAEILAEDGDFPAALEQVYLAQTAVPDDAYSLIMEGAYHAVQGESEQAEQAYTAARAQSEDDNEFLVQRAQVYMRLGNGEAALEDLNVVIERDPTSAVAYYLKGSTEQALNMLDEAYNSYQTAVDLAEAADDTQLSGLARVQMAYLTQQMMSAPLAVPTATPQP